MTTANRNKFLELLEKKKQAERVKPEILKPKNLSLTTDAFSPILLQSSQILSQNPGYRIMSCFEHNQKRQWLLILNEGSKEQS